MSLPPDILLLRVAPFCDFPTLLRLAECSVTASKGVARGEFLMQARRAFAEQRLTQAGAPKELVARLNNLPKAIEWMRRHDLERMGSTGYIDFLTSTSFSPSKPVLYGKDLIGRFYVASCYVWNNHLDVACLFQRYSDDDTFYVNSRDSLSDYAVYTSNLASKSNSHRGMATHHEDLLQLAMTGAVQLESGEEVYLLA